MAARVNSEQVKALINTPDAVIDQEKMVAFILTANTLVDATLLNEGYTDDVLFQIELHLSAHFAALRDRQVASDANVTFQGKTGTGLEGSLFGQAAMTLDYHGVLTRMKTGKSPASIQALP